MITVYDYARVGLMIKIYDYARVGLMITVYDLREGSLDDNCI